jgi:adenylate cyclase
MPRVSITVKYSMLVLLSIVATSGLLFWFVLDLVRTEVRDQLIRRGESTTQQLAFTLAPVLLSKDDAKVRAVLNKVLEDPDIVDGVIIDPNDRHAIAAADPALIGRPFTDPQVPWQQNNCAGLIEDLPRDRLVIMHPASFSGVRVGCVALQVSRAAMTRAVAEVTTRMLSLSAIIALVVIALSFLTLRRALKPLERVIDGTKRIADGDFSTRLLVSSRDEIGDLAEAFNGMAARTELFFRYLDKSIAERLVLDESLARPGGQLKQVSVLFGDMRGFTNLSNERSPTEVVWVLNTYFDLFFQVVHSFNGVVDKTMGDAIMAFFEPFRTSDTSNAQRATLSAVAMRAAVWTLEQVIAQGRSLSLPLRISACHFGFSVATGRLIVGNIGSSRHMDYTVCGPPVNLAARLQEDTRRGEIIVDRFTAMDMETLVEIREMPRVLPKGFAPSQEVTPYLVVDVCQAELVRLRQLLRHLFTRRFFLDHVVAIEWDGKPLPVDKRETWSSQLYDLSMQLIDQEPVSFLVR